MSTANTKSTMSSTHQSWSPSRIYADPFAESSLSIRVASVKRSASAGPSRRLMEEQSSSASMSHRSAHSTPSRAVSLGAIPVTSLEPDTDAYGTYVSGRSLNIDAKPELPKPQSKNSFVKMAMWLDRDVYLAGQPIEGRLEIECRTGKKMRIGDIVLEITGYEEVADKTVKVKVTRRMFLESALVLQGSDTAPSDAVVPSRPDNAGFFLAKKGMTVFSFKIPVPSKTNVEDRSLAEHGPQPLPSSFWSKKFGGIRYVVSAYVHTKPNSAAVTSPAPPPLALHRDVFLLGSHPLHLPRFPARLFTDSQLLNGVKGEFGGWLTKGSVYLRAWVNALGGMEDQDCDTGVWIAGAVGTVGVEIRNQSAKKITNLRLSLIRRVKTFTRTPPKSSKSRPDLPPSPGITPVYPSAFQRKLAAQKTYTAARVDEAHAPTFRNGSDLPWCEENEDDDTGKAEANVRAAKWSSWCGVEPGEERRVGVGLDVPITCRTVTGTIFIDVSFCIQVGISAGDDDLSFEIPVAVVHPTSTLVSLPPFQLDVAARSPIRLNRSADFADLPVVRMEKIETPGQMTSTATLLNHTPDITQSPSMHNIRHQQVPLKNQVERADVRGPSLTVDTRISTGIETPMTSSLVFPNRGRSTSVRAPNYIISEPVSPTKRANLITLSKVESLERTGTARSQQAEIEVGSDESGTSGDEWEREHQDKTSHQHRMKKKEVENQFDELFKELELLKI